MSKENVEDVRGVYDRWSNGDFQASLDLFDPLALLVQRAGFPEAGTYLGVEKIVEYTRGFLEPWTRIAIEVEDMTEAGESVVAAVRQRGVGAASGATTEFRYYQVWSFRGCKVIRLENFRERSDALEAVGLSEQAMSRENVEIVRQGFDIWEAAWNSGTDDLGALLSIFDADLVTRRLAPMPDPGTWHGLEGMLAVLTEWTDTFGEFTMRGEEFIDAGDQVIVRVEQEGRGDDSGVPVTGTFWFVLGVRDRKMATLDMYATREEALEAAGLTE
jgi:ketosteroid isomerase-like protein